MNIFEYATRHNLLFSSDKGSLTVQDLWQLPLTSTRGVSLDSIGKKIRKELHESEDDSLVETNKNTKATATLTIMFDIIKHIINVKQTEATERKVKIEEDAKINLIESILQERKQMELYNMSSDELMSIIEKSKEKKV